MSSLKHSLASDSRVIKVPGVYDGLSTLLVEKAGFDLAFLSGAGLSFTRYGKPDLGLVSMREIAETVRVIRELSQIPLVVDIDTGFGNAINVIRCVKLMEACGANALQIEDQQFPKRCGHLKNKQVVSQQEMVGKIKAALDTRESSDTLIFARTDALSVTGFGDAVERAGAYLEAGADALFIEAPQTPEQLQIISESFAEKVPLIFNMVEGGSGCKLSVADLEALKFKLALYPVSLIHAFVPKAQAVLSHIQERGDLSGFNEDLLELADMNTLLGTEAALEQVENY